MPAPNRAPKRFKPLSGATAACCLRYEAYPPTTKRPITRGIEAMSYDVGAGDLVLCVNAAPNHVTGEPVPLVAGESYRVLAVMDFACPCGRSDALLDVGVDFAWCQTRFRLMPKPKFESRTRAAPAPKEKVKAR